MDIEIELDGDAEMAYKRILETLENQAEREIEPSCHAETVLRQYISQEFGQLIAQGDSQQQSQRLPVDQS